MGPTPCRPRIKYKVTCQQGRNQYPKIFQQRKQEENYTHELKIRIIEHPKWKEMECGHILYNAFIVFTKKLRPKGSQDLPKIT